MLTFPLVLSIYLKYYLPAVFKHTLLLERLSSIEDRGQTDLVTALTFDLDLWPWLSVPGKLQLWPTHKNSSSNVSQFKRESGNKRTDRRTDRQTLSIAFPSWLTRLVNI